jgi:hypothetical protein
VLTNLKKAWELLRAQVESVQNRVRTQEAGPATEIERQTRQRKERDTSGPEMQGEITGLKQQLASA